MVSDRPSVSALLNELLLVTSLTMTDFACRKRISTAWFLSCFDFRRFIRCCNLTSFTVDSKRQESTCRLLSYPAVHKALFVKPSAGGDCSAQFLNHYLCLVSQCISGILQENFSFADLYIAEDDLINSHAKTTLLILAGRRYLENV